MSLSAHDTALARARTYGWIAEVLLDGWTDRALSVAETLDWLELPADPDVRAARHAAVLERGVPPYESVFTAEDGLLGGPVAHAVRDAYARVGFAGLRQDVEPDHVGLQAAALAFLCAAESDARRDARPDGELARIASAQQDLLRAHLGRWVSLFAGAVARQGVAELTGVVGLLESLVVGHLDSPLANHSVETLDGLLDDPKTGLKDVAAALTVPVRCGVWVSVADIQRIAEQAELACGFGPRRKMLETLWFSAVDHERVPALCAAFVAELDAWDARLDGAGEGAGSASGAQARAATRRVLARLEEASRTTGVD
jgi:hypothetical protein